jgi:hypothetical protein
LLAVAERLASAAKIHPELIRVGSFWFVLLRGSYALLIKENVPRNQSKPHKQITTSGTRALTLFESDNYYAAHNARAVGFN